MTPWRLVWSRQAARVLDALPIKVAAAVHQFVSVRMSANPYRTTKALSAPFEGMRSGNVGHYRVIVVLDDESETIAVVRVAHRADAYRAS